MTRPPLKVRLFVGFDSTTPKPNQITVNYLNQIAHCDNLPIEARIVDTRAAGITYIHNKGIIVDSDIAIVSSINGTQNSAMNNREVAVALQSPEAAKYFGQAFSFDWGDLGRQKSLSAGAHATRSSQPSAIQLAGLPLLLGCKNAVAGGNTWVLNSATEFSIRRSAFCTRVFIELLCVDPS